MNASSDQTQNGDNTRIAWLDYAKGIGIILVVYGHVISGLSNAGILQTIPVSWKLGMDLSVRGIYTFHMPLFFFLSGLLFKDNWIKNDRQRAELARKKITNLMYPYLIWSIVFSAITLIFASQLNGGGTTLADIPIQILFAPKSHLWFLYTLCLINLIVIGLKKFLPLAAIIGLSTIMLLMHDGVPGILSSVMSLTLFFVVGHKLSNNILQTKWEISSQKYVIWGLMVLTIHIVALITVMLSLGRNDPIPFLVFIGSSALGIVAIGLFSQGLAQARQLRWLAILGEDCVYIYILHMLSWVAARIILQKVFKVDQFMIHFIVGMVAGLVPPIFLGHLSKRYFPWLFSTNSLSLFLAKSRPSSD